MYLKFNNCLTYQDDQIYQIFQFDGGKFLSSLENQS